MIGGLSWPLENRRGSSQLPVTVGKGSLDTSFAGQTCKDIFCNACANHAPKHNARERHRCSCTQRQPSASGQMVRTARFRDCPCSQRSFVVLPGKTRDSCTLPSASRPRCPPTGICVSFLHNTSRKSQNYPHPASKSVDSKPDVQLRKNVHCTLKQSCQ